MEGTVRDVAENLASAVGNTVPLLEEIGEEGSLVTRGDGTWSRKQILGHLIDSALNNVQRFVRAQHQAELAFDDYDQPGWVAAGGYQDRPWTDMVTLWAVLNVHLVHVIARVPPGALETPCRIGASEPMTLESVIRDYMRHLDHHLDQIRDPETSREKTDAPSGEE